MTKRPGRTQRLNQNLMVLDGLRNHIRVVPRIPRPGTISYHGPSSHPALGPFFLASNRSGTILALRRRITGGVARTRRVKWLQLFAPSSRLPELEPPHPAFC
jgi:hypothetical protein